MKTIDLVTVELRIYTDLDSNELYDFLQARIPYSNDVEIVTRESVLVVTK
jgi:hypothetical protein